jgi:hypothetical protein
MTTSSRLLVALALALVATAVPRSAHAQATEPSAAELESARELYKEGKELRQKGDHRGALERFKAAHGYGQTPVTGLELGKAHLQLGELVEAREVLLSIARIKVASDETEKSAAARTEAAELAEQIRPRIPTIVVKVSGLKADETPQVAVDGANAPVVAMTTMRKINPGEHTVVVRASGREEKRTVAVAEGETKEIPVAVTDASPRAGEAPGGAPEGGSPRRIHVVTWIGVGVGVVGLGLGGVTGAMALGKSSTVKDACVGLSCPPSAKSDVEDGRTLANLSTVGFAVGVVGLAVAAVGYFVLSPRRTAAVALAPGWGGLHGTF